MHRSLVLAATFLTLSCSDSTAPTSSDSPLAALIPIDFEQYPGPDGMLGTRDDVRLPGCPGNTGTCVVTSLSNEFESVGVMFENWFVTYQHGDNPNNFSNNNHRACAGSDPQPLVRLRVPIFGVAVTSLATWPVRLDAFDTDGALIGSSFLPHPNPGCLGSCPQVHGIVVFDSTVPIASFRLTNVSPGGEFTGGCVDNLILRPSQN